MAAVEPGVLSGPEFLHAPQVLVRSPAPVLESDRQAQSFELLPHPADPAAHDEPALGEDVQGGQHLGRQDRVAVGQDQTDVRMRTRDVWPQRKARVMSISRLFWLPVPPGNLPVAPYG